MERWVGGVFLLTLAGYIYAAFRQERTAQDPPDHGAAYDKGLALREADPGTAPAPVRGVRGPILLPLVITVAGLALVILGGTFLVDGAVSLARSFGISETVIGLTVVAIGTSLPELVTSVLAALRRQGDVAFGNIVGSNIYNLLGIGGATALIAPGAVPPEIVGFDLPMTLAVTVLLIAFAWTGLRIGRREGAVLFAGYLAYVYAIWP